jgi:hypothetical protein
VSSSARDLRQVSTRQSSSCECIQAAIKRLLSLIEEVDCSNDDRAVGMACDATSYEKTLAVMKFAKGGYHYDASRG